MLPPIVVMLLVTLMVLFVLRRVSDRIYTPDDGGSFSERVRPRVPRLPDFRPFMPPEDRAPAGVSPHTPYGRGMDLYLQRGFAEVCMHLADHARQSRPDADQT